MMPKKKKTAGGGAKTASDAIQPPLPPANRTMGSVRAPDADIERVMNALQENRWNRKRRLLPNLKLKYPSEDKSRHIAELAGVDEASFSHHIQSIILDAHLDDA